MTRDPSKFLSHDERESNALTKLRDRRAAQEIAWTAKQVGLA